MSYDNNEIQRTSLMSVLHKIYRDMCLFIDRSTQLHIVYITGAYRQTKASRMHSKFSKLIQISTQLI